MSQTRQEIRRQWAELQKQIHEPGKMHKVKRLAIAQLPVHPQYIDVGTSFNADLLQPLDFGTESVMPEALTNIGVRRLRKRGTCAADNAAEFGDIEERRIGRGGDHGAAGRVGPFDPAGGQRDSRVGDAGATGAPVSAQRAVANPVS